VQAASPRLCAGKPDGPLTPTVPTTRLKVRQAYAAALDPVQIDARVYEGKGKPGTELVDKSASFYPAVPGHTYDLNKAKQLVQDAKAEGWDGKIRWVCSNNPYGQSITQAGASDAATGRLHRRDETCRQRVGRRDHQPRLRQCLLGTLGSH
jgi:hypothetical protein